MVFLIALLVYGLTLCRTVYFGDSGELTAAASCLGIPHPTGYPLYLLLVKAFSYLVPFGSFVFKANLFSALCTAAACQVFCRALRESGVPRWPATGAALGLGFLPPIWSQATVARTYPLVTLCGAALFLIWVRWRKDGDSRWWWVSALVLGLGLTNHTMVLSFLALFVIWVLVTQWRELANGRAVAKAVVALLVPLSIYAYLPLRAASDPVIEYHVPVQTSPDLVFGDLAAFDNLLAYLRRDLHHEHRWARGVSDYATITVHHVLEVGRAFHGLGVVFLVIGAAVLWRRDRAWLWAVLALWCLSLAPLAWHGAWWDVFLYPRYMTCGFLGLAWVAAFGVARGAEWVSGRFGARGGAVVALLFPVSLLGFHWQRMDRSDFHLAEDYARALLTDLPEDAQVFSGADQALYPLMVLTTVEDERPDLSLVNPTQLRGEADWFLAVNPRRSGELQGRTPRALFTPDWASEIPKALVRHRDGMVFRVQPRDRPFEAREFVLPQLRGLDDPSRLDVYSASVAVQIEATLADALYAAGQHDAARARLEKILTRVARRPWGYMEGASLAARMKDRGHLPDFSLAIGLVELALEHADPRNAAALASLRNLEGLEGRRHWDRATKLRQSDPEQALEHMVQAARLLPSERGLVKAAINGLAKAGRPDDALELLNAALTRFPEDADLQSYRQRLGGG